MIHQYKNNGYNIILDINSGSVHVADDIVYELLPLVEKLVKDGVTESKEILAAPGVQPMLSVHSTQSLLSAIEEILELYRTGQLFTQDVYEDYIRDFKKRKTVVKALCLHVAHDCNLACRYCFAGEGEYAGARALMSLETGKKALDFLVKNSGNRVNLEVDFFGGEPLMNWEVVTELVRYGRSLEEPFRKKFRFTLTTNGILLTDDKLEFINAEMSNVVLSIDGRREVNDRMRPRRGGQGSYDEILPRFLKVAESRNQTGYYVRGTFTRHNLDFTRDVLHLADLGFRQISVEPVVAAPFADRLSGGKQAGEEAGPAGEQQSKDYALREEDIPALLEEYDRLAGELIQRKKEGKEFHFFHYMMDLEGGPCAAKRLSGCGSGTEYLAVTPQGDFYPCHQFVGREGFLMGNVHEGVRNVALGDSFKACSVYSREKCRECFARFYCSGGCAANSHQFHGDINDVYDLGCILQRKRVECAIMIKAADMM